MQIAYLILAHRCPGQLKRLVHRLHAPNVWIFIHLDNKTVNVLDFFEVTREVENVFFIPLRVEVSWGGYSMVQATLNGLKEIVKTGYSFDYVSLMSGQDYPIKSNQYIFDFYSRNYGREFIHYRLFPSDDIPHYLRERTEYYNDYDNANTTFGSPNSGLYEKEMQMRSMKRNFIQGMKPFHGSQWWSLTGKCVGHIADSVERNKDIINFYRYTKFPDEHFFQTMVMNSEFASNVSNESLWHIDWSSKDGQELAHPRTLDRSDFPALAASDRLFARKFDAMEDTLILDMLDGLL